MITVLHPWHGAHYGSQAPVRVNGLIEISQAAAVNMKLISQPDY